MTPKHLLVHVDSSDRAAERVALAAHLARRFGARLVGLFAESESLGASIVGRRTAEGLREAMERARAAFETRTRAAGIAADWWHLGAESHAQLVARAAACCRYVDLAIFGQHPPEDARVPEDLVEQALLHGGRPLLVVPYAGSYADVGRQVLIGWNASREAARALNDAIPLIEGAQAVTLLAFQEPGSSASEMPPLDIVGHLAAHGIAARYERITPQQLGEAAVVDALLNRGFELGADLTVAAVGREDGRPLLSRRGGTRDLLRSMVTPVLMSY